MKKKTGKVIVMHNDLIGAYFGLSRMAHRLMHYLAAHFHPFRDDVFRRHMFHVDELYEVIGVTGQTIKKKREALSLIIGELCGDTIEIPCSDDRSCLKFTAWIEAPEIDYQNNMVTMRAAEWLRPYFLRLADGFYTIMSWDEANRLKLKKGSSLKFLWLCKNHEARADYHDRIVDGRYVKDIKLTIKEIKRWCRISDTYADVNNLKKRFLEVIRQEINAKTSSYYEMKMVKNPLDKRKIVAVKFVIFGDFVSGPSKSPSQPSVPRVKSSSKDKSLGRRLLKLGVSESMIDFVLQSGYSYGKLHINIEAVEFYKKNNRLRNPDRVITTALLEDWISTKEEIRRNKTLKAEQAALEKETAENLARELSRREEEKTAELARAEEEKQAEYQLDFEKRVFYMGEDYKLQPDKVGFVIDQFELFPALNPEEQEFVKNEIASMIDSGEKFDNIYTAAGVKIIGCLRPFESSGGLPN